MICFLDHPYACLSACDPVSLPVSCQAPCGLDWLSVCLSVGLLFCFPIKSVCPPNGQIGLLFLSLPAVCHHNCLSVCLLTILLLVSLAVHLSLSLCVSLCLPGGQSVLPSYLSACLFTLLFPIPTFLHVWSWVYSSPKATLLGPEPGLAAPSEAEQAASEPGPPSSPPAPAQPPASMAQPPLRSAPPSSLQP